MKRITAIEFVNYKAFYQSGEQNKIIIPQGKSVLIYGENGSGKSSIYEGLKQFFASSDATLEITPARHIKVPMTWAKIENQGTPEETSTEITNEVSVKVTFSDHEGDEIKTFGVLQNDTQTANYIAQSNLLNSFLSYRELLRTYLMENPKDRKEFRIKFAQLVIEVILAKQINTVTQQTFQKSWNDLFLPRRMYKVENLTKFTRGLQSEINRINLLLPTLLNYFEKGFSATLSIPENHIEYHHSAKVDRTGNYPIYEIDLDVSLFGEGTHSEEENHLTVLNEARLSSLAISIYLASLINTPQENFVYRILFLDDIFIGLDMSNRLPLLEILKNFKKPIIEQFVEGENPIGERIQTIGSEIQTEPEPFFRNYQIFISTYDRFWFSVAKNWFETKSNGKWCYFEMFASQKEGLAFNTPLMYTSLNNLQKANYHYSKHDYPTCANHLRKALEERLKVLLPINEHYAEYTNTEIGITEIKKLKTLNQYLEKFIIYCDSNGIDASELVDLKNLKDWYFNPFSHDNIQTPIFKKELTTAKELVEKIDRFEFKILLQAGERLHFNFDNRAGQTRNYKIELQENLRWIKSENGDVLTNPIVRCYEWTRNVDIQIDPPWGVSKLFNFYNNKWKHLLRNHNLPNVDMATLWNQLHHVSNNQPLRLLIN
jgi:energy-coupling factor transporter ATP-binding protein EcfA2